MGVSFIVMAYNMIDMIWIGQLGSSAVTAVGTAGLFLNFNFSISSLIYIGAGIKIAHSVGEGNRSEAKAYAENALLNVIILILSFMCVVLLFEKQLIGFFNIQDSHINQMALSYLTIATLGMIASAITLVSMRIFNAHGDSKIPFKITSVGLILNIILDPILIFGLLGMPRLGVMGAAIATVISQFVVMIAMVIILRKRFGIFSNGYSYNLKYSKALFRIGSPVATQRILFTIISLIIARIVASWGPDAIAVQRIGLQIESISYMTAGGVQGALVAFIGQNFGAKKYLRIIKSFFSAIGISSLFGLFMSAILILTPEPIFRVFLQENRVVALGVNYLMILGVSQLFMILEITSTGAFQGLGKTLPPAIISIILTGARIPMALALSATALGLNGVWWSITISSILKGTIISVMFMIFIYKRRDIINKASKVSHE